MKPDTIVGRLQHETNALRGDDTKDRTYSSQHTYPDEAPAREAFARSVAKLLDVNGWSALSNLSADFVLHDQAGLPKVGGLPQPGDYVQIKLPGPTPDNWVRVIDIIQEDDRAEFTVQPSRDPREKPSAGVEHFFREEARSTFRVARSGNMLIAWEVGTDEAINNRGPEAGDRSVINTIIAEGGWLFYQQMQWKLLTDYLVHLS